MMTATAIGSTATTAAAECYPNGATCWSIVDYLLATTMGVVLLATTVNALFGCNSCDEFGDFFFLYLFFKFKLTAVLK